MSTRRVQGFYVEVWTDVEHDEPPFTEGDIQNAVQQFAHRERGYRPHVTVEDA